MPSQSHHNTAAIRPSITSAFHYLKESIAAIEGSASRLSLQECTHRQQTNVAVDPLFHHFYLGTHYDKR
ncbi:MAG: hypothetical protein K5Q00_04785 [Gammaproteobacteria bacterium]|nr:hypothetical protein [Gammaproteobacteria bacterium]